MKLQYYILLVLFMSLQIIKGADFHKSDTLPSVSGLIDSLLLSEKLDWSVRLVSNFKQQQFRLSNGDSKLIYRPNNPFGVGFGVANQKMVIDVLFNIKGDSEEVTNKFAAEGAIIINKNMYGFAIENVHGYNITSKQTDEQEFRDDISVFSLGLEYLRILSKNRITVRGMKAGMTDQRNTILSYGVGGFLIVKNLTADGSIIPEADWEYFNEQAQIYETSSIGGGALGGVSSYFNLPGHFFATVYVASGIGLEYKYIKSEAYNYVASNPWILKTDLFGSLGYNRKKFYVHFTFGTDWYLSNIDYDNQLFLSVTKSKFIVGFNLDRINKKKSTN